MLDLNKIAYQLREASNSHQLLSPIRDVIGNQNVDDAYKVQQININHRIESGAQLVGRKIGLTNKKVQHQLGVDQPDFGSLLNTMQVKNQGKIPWSELHQPKAEAEIAFILKSEIKEKGLEQEKLIQKIDYATCSIEIVGSRIKNWDIQITDTIADNASASHFVLAESKTSMNDFDWVNCQMKMTKNGKLASEGSGAACLGSPLVALQWLADIMIDMNTPLKSGDIVLSGALGPMVNVMEGDDFTAEIEGLGKAKVSF